MSQINITVLNVNQTTQPSKTGKTYQMLEVAYKNNTFQGKVESKKIMPFGAQKNAFDALAVAQPGESFDVEVVKNGQGYNDWVAVAKATAGPVAGPNKAPTQATTGAQRSGNWETAEERAKRQIYIVRQSSIGHAVSLLSTGAKAPPKLDDVLTTAKSIEQYVFGTGETGFEDLPDFDLPEQPQID